MRDYQREQAYQIMRYGPDHSTFTQRAAALPQLADLLQRRDPERDHFYYVLNGSERELYGGEMDGYADLRVFPVHDVLIVWKDSHLVLGSMPGEKLRVFQDHRHPQSHVVRWISQVKIDPE